MVNYRPTGCKSAIIVFQLEKSTILVSCEVAAFPEWTKGPHESGQGATEPLTFAPSLRTRRLRVNNPHRNTLNAYKAVSSQKVGYPVPAKSRQSLEGVREL